MTEDEMVGWHHQLNGHEFGSWWWAGKPIMLQSIVSQRVGHDWVTELNWKLHLTDISFSCWTSLFAASIFATSPTHSFICKPKNNTWGFFPNCLKMQSSKKKEIRVAQHACFQLRLKKQLLCFLFSPLILYSSILPICFFFFSISVLFVTLLFKMAPMLKCCLVFQSTERLWWTLWRKHWC